MSDLKFERGDAVVPINSKAHPKRTVRRCLPYAVYFYGDTRVHNPNHFELVQNTAEQPVLTPQEVFTAILEGVPLEYRVLGVRHNQHWFDVTNPKHIDLADVECSEFRKQVQTVTLSGTVPKPAPFDSIEVSDKVYTIYLSTMTVAVVNGRYALNGGFYWRTQAEAEQVRDTLNQCFSAVPVLN